MSFTLAPAGPLWACADPPKSNKASVGPRLRKGILQHPAKRVGGRGELRIARQRSELGRCGYKALASFGVADDVVECNRPRPDVTDRSRNANEVVVPGARMKTETCLDDGERHVLPLELCVRCTQRA